MLSSWCQFGKGTRPQPSLVTSENVPFQNDEVKSQQPQHPLPEFIEKDSHLIRWVYGCFFLSGFTALIYEVAWLNRIQLVMGHSIYSLVTTLASFLSGLALGAWFAPRILSRGHSPFLLYLLAELGIGIFGLVFYPLLQLLQIPYQFLIPHFQFSLLGESFLQFVFCGSLILVPTFLMGTTLPFVCAFLFQRTSEISEKLPSLYGVNTLGAAVGCFAAGFWILPLLGYQKTVLLAAALNLGLVLVSFVVWKPSLLGRGSGFPASPDAVVQEQKEGEKATAEGSLTDLSFLGVLFASGFFSVVSQAIWNRLAMLNFGPSVYIFPQVTLIVLFGIVLGSWLWRKISDPNSFGKKHGEIFGKKEFFCFLPFLAALAFDIGNHLFSYASILVLHWNQSWNPSFGFRIWLQIFLLSCCLLPSAVFLGALFPGAVSLLTEGRKVEEGTAQVGKGYALNIAGMVLGAVLGSFILIPKLGIEKLSTVLSVSLVAVSSFLIVLRMRVILPVFLMLGLFGIVASLLPAFDWNLLSDGFFYNRYRITEQELEVSGFSDLYGYIKSNRHQIIFKKEDATGVVVVKKAEDSLSFLINGKPDGSIQTKENRGGDLRTTRLLGLFPALVTSQARSALVVGLGVGSTVGQLLRYPEMEEVTVVELSPAMIEASQTLFAHALTEGAFWLDPLLRKKVRIENKDGRAFLEQSQRTFDIIVSEPSNPWVDGVASLFTLEYYETLAKRLRPGGVASLWLHSYRLDCESIYSVLSAISYVFPSVSVFYDGVDFYILASNSPHETLIGSFPATMREAEKTFFTELGLKGGVAEKYGKLVSRFWIHNQVSLKKFAQIQAPNRDDTQFLQFQAGKMFFRDIACSSLFRK